MRSNETMDIYLAKEIIDFLSTINIKHLILIGGEPTLHPNIIEIISYAKTRNIKTVLVTNGILLANKEFSNDLIKVGLQSINVSIKAENDNEYEKLCGTKGFSKVVKALKNLKEFGISHSVSLVISKHNHNKLCNVVKSIVDHTEAKIQLSFCMPTFDDFGINDDNDSYMTPIEYANALKNDYSYINEVTKGLFSLHQNLPFCVWDEQILNEMMKKNQITSSCHALKRNGLIFDTNGCLLLCNMLADYPYGKFHDSFKDKESFKLFWDNTDIVSLHTQLTNVPDVKCLGCIDFNKCGGGCPVQWFKFDFKQCFANN